MSPSGALLGFQDKGFHLKLR